MQELYIVRHGMTVWNTLHRLQGRRDIPLDEGGRALTIETAQGMKDIDFDVCFTSPLSRARETAEILLRGREVPVILDERLLEMNFGEAEGLVCSPSLPGYDPLTEKALALTLSGYEPAPGGETMDALLERTASFFEDIILCPEYADSRILVSTHGAAGRALMHHVWGGDTFWHGGVPKNCTVCIVKVQDGTVTGWRQDVVYYKRDVPEFI